MHTNFSLKTSKNRPLRRPSADVGQHTGENKMNLKGQGVRLQAGFAWLTAGLCNELSRYIKGRGFDGIINYQLHRKASAPQS
jgi:hypothetical protein